MKRSREGCGGGARPGAGRARVFQGRIKHGVGWVCLPPLIQKKLKQEAKSKGISLSRLLLLTFRSARPDLPWPKLEFDPEAYGEV